MSKVYSFRLSDDNPREIQAREVIDAWILKGYPLRFILTEALLHYDDNGYQNEEIITLVDQFRRLISEFSKTQFLEGDSLSKKSISSHFIESVKKSAKLGVKVDE